MPDNNKSDLKTRLKVEFQKALLVEFVMPKL